jgi:hypothetical protein
VGLQAGKEKHMPEQQKEQSQKQKPPPNLSEGADKEAAGKPGFKSKDPKKAGTEEEDDDKNSSCGTGSCG